MRLGHVIGRVTLSQQDPSYRGGRFLLVQPWVPAAAEPLAGGPVRQRAGSALVVYDNLGAALGSLIGFTEGSEAAKPFAEATPVDAFNAAIADEIFHQPPK
ncbi:MAG: EutN/CcmL family microcompartment protein [Opitutaceae bacterium]